VADHTLGIRFYSYCTGALNIHSNCPASCCIYSCCATLTLKTNIIKMCYVPEINKNPKAQIDKHFKANTIVIIL
jgi:hypothetical protein